MKKKVLVTYAMPRIGYAALEEKFEVTLPKTQFTREEVLDMISDYDALLSMYDFKVNSELLDKAPKLKIVSNYAVGYDNIDVPECTKRNIVVTNTPGPVTEPTADQALGLMLAVARNITLSDKKFRAGTLKWGLLENLGVSLYGKQLGIIGMGRIGKALARRAVACGMRIVYNNRNQISKEEEALYNAKFVSFDELIKTSDFISVNAPHTPETTHMIDKEQFDMMKESAILINTARGPLVHEQALIDALKSNRILGAGLDVFEFGETVSPGLLELDNVVLNPHTGTQTIDVRIEMTVCAGKNIIGIFAGAKYIGRAHF